jgi:ribosomal-protein-alanine N-acetyltransferase
VNRGPVVSLELRAMRWWDLDDVLPLERELFGESAWTAEIFWSELAQRHTRWYVVARREGRTVGYAGLLAPGGEADVQTIAVDRRAQGAGVGRFLLDALIDEARRRQAGALLLEVRADNEPAKSLYGSRGFERIALRRRYYQPGDVDAWVMRLRPLRAPGDAAPGISSTG